MGNLFLWLLFLVYFASSFQYSFLLGGANRAFLGLYKAIPESHVIAYGEDGEDIVPYFEEEALEEDCRAYVVDALAVYHLEASLEFTWKWVDPYPEEGRHNYVAVRMKCPILRFCQFDKTLHFQIVRYQGERE